MSQLNENGLKRLVENISKEINAKINAFIKTYTCVKDDVTDEKTTWSSSKVSGELDKKSNTHEHPYKSDSYVPNWNEVVNKPTEFNPSNHNHNDSYYLKSDIDNKFDRLNNLVVEVVAELPTTGEPNKVYLVNNMATEENLYTEYIWIDGKWEVWGSASIDLSPYATKSELNSGLSGKSDIHDHPYKSNDYVPSWNEISEKPSTFAPGEHTHSILNGDLSINGATTIGGKGGGFTGDILNIQSNNGTLRLYGDGASAMHFGGVPVAFDQPPLFSEGISIHGHGKGVDFNNGYVSGLGKVSAKAGSIGTIEVATDFNAYPQENTQNFIAFNRNVGSGLGASKNWSYQSYSYNDTTSEFERVFGVRADGTIISKGQEVSTIHEHPYKPSSYVPSWGEVTDKPAMSSSTTSTSTSTIANSYAVKLAMDKANEAFQSANSGKTSIANAIGSPASSSNTHSQLASYITSGKSTLASNLNSKGVSASSSESLSSLASKVGNIQTGGKYIWITERCGFSLGSGSSGTHNLSHSQSLPSGVYLDRIYVNLDRVRSYSGTDSYIANATTSDLGSFSFASQSSIQITNKSTRGFTIQWNDVDSSRATIHSYMMCYIVP